MSATAPALAVDLGRPGGDQTVEVVAHQEGEKMVVDSVTAVEPQRPDVLTPEAEAELRLAWAAIDPWEKTDDFEDTTCPLCDGEGYVDGFQLDSEQEIAATLGGYGIGKGLAAAELVAGSTGPLLATLDAERAEVERLRAVLRATHERHCNESWTSRGLHAPDCLMCEVMP